MSCYISLDPNFFFAHIMGYMCASIACPIVSYSKSSNNLNYIFLNLLEKITLFQESLVEYRRHLF